NDSYSKCSVYSIELKIDSSTLFRYVMDDFSFNESRYINSHIDYEAYQKERTYFERTFLLPNDKLSVYENVVNRGIFNFNEDKTYHIEIEVADIHNNRAVLTFDVQGQQPLSHDKPGSAATDLNLMPYNSANTFTAENISIAIPTGALYDTLYFEYKKEKGPQEMLSEVHYIHNKFTPVHKAYTLAIKPYSIPVGKESKMLIVQMNDDFKKSALSSSITDGYVTAQALSFGMFYVGIDTVAPMIAPNGLSSGIDLTDKREIRIRIFDELAGIKSYEPTIDGNWALFEYDQKNNVLIYRFDPKRIAKGTKHNLTLKVSDNVDNTSFYNCDFTW
ncbi:MAG: hypothetical protein NTW82_04715, partial [Bacteroidia bacterium]|nr:hypothetical protein [Bacteroidia bacterium]